jgi:hypothetical protein
MGSETDNKGKNDITHLPDPRKHPEYEPGLKTTIESLEKVLNMLKNGEAVLYAAQNANLLMKQGKSEVGKPTGINRILVDYMGI